MELEIIKRKIQLKSQALKLIKAERRDLKTTENKMIKQGAAKFILPYVATVVTRLPCRRGLSLLLDRLLVLAEGV